MKNPGHKSKSISLFLAGWAMGAAMALAQTPDTAVVKPTAPKTRPQVIYHLPPAGSSKLHSQAKGQNNEMPIGENAPAPSQTPRVSPNPTAAPQVQAKPSPQSQRATPKVQRPRPQPHARTAVKPGAHGNGHGNKSHKK